MFDAFSKDDSGFKTSILMMFLVSCIFLVASFYLLNIFNNALAENNRLSAEYQSQAEWFQQFDKDGALRLEKEIIRPCKADEVDKVQQRQLEVLSSHGLRIISVRKANSNTSAKVGGVKAIVMAVALSGSWDDFRSAFNNFEKQDSLVVITRLNLRSGSPVACNMEYAIYYK